MSFTLIFIFIYLVLVFVITQEIFRRLTLSRAQDLGGVKAEYEKRRQQKEAILAEKKQLDQVAQEIFTLYDMTKEITKQLSDVEALQIFKNKLRENFSCEDCWLLDPLSSEVKNFKDTEGYLFFPLRAKTAHLGYLVVKGIPEQDKEKLTILVHQFMLALQRIRLYEDIEKMAMTDSLTAVFTRRYIMQRLEEEKNRAEARKTPCSFLMIDVDRFKGINDRYGHLTGDMVLREVSRVIREHVREIDICGRYGGEEFCVVLPDTGQEGAYYVAERIRAAVEKAMIQAYDTRVKVTVSVGTATFPEDGKDLTELLDKADWAMYRAKKSGRNAVYSAGGPQKPS